MSAPSDLDEQAVLCRNPFEGDFGAPGDRVLKDKMIMARRPGPCHMCALEIQPLERARVRVELVDGGLMSFRWCYLCCRAMASSWTDQGAAEEARFALRQRLTLAGAPGNTK